MTEIPNKKEEIQTFSLLIEKIARDKRCSYMDAIIYHCEQTGFEIELAAKIISSALKAKIKMEAEDLHFLPPNKTNRLPI